MTTAKRQTVADFLYYSICQGQSEIGPIGYSSLPINLVQAGFTQIGKLKTADSAVDLTNRNVSTCHNPTFIAGKPKVNHLAQIAPNPPACDKEGAGPCAAGVGAYNGNDPSQANNSSVATNTATGASLGGGAPTGSSSGTTSPGGGTTGDGSGTTGVTTTPGGSDDLGLGTGTTTAETTGTGTVVATTLEADSDSGPSGVLTGLVVALFVVAVASPAVAARMWRGRR